MGAKFKGTTPEMLSRRLQINGRATIDALEEIIDQTISEASEDQRNILDAATTRYGAERMSKGQGRTAGRNDSGAMIDSIGQRRFQRGREVVGQWGWLMQDVPDYIKYQENGTGRIKAARSLLDSYVRARADFIRRVRRVVDK